MPKREIPRFPEENRDGLFASFIDNALFCRSQEEENFVDRILGVTGKNTTSSVAFFPNLRQ